MELEEEKGEVSFVMRIKEFSTYEDLDQEFTSVFHLSLNKFRSLWSVTVSPFVKDKDCLGEDSVLHDIGITLQCLRCNVNFPQIEVYSEMLGKDQHEKRMTQPNPSVLSWRGTLTARLALKVFKLLKDDELAARLRFVIKGSDMTNSVDGLESLATQMRQILESKELSDVDILTRDGARIPAHSAILSCRSNLLERCTETNKYGVQALGNTPEKELKCPRVNYLFRITETPINSSFGSMSSGYQSATNSSLDSNLKTVNSTKCKVLNSPISCITTNKIQSPIKSSTNFEIVQSTNVVSAICKPKSTLNKLSKVSANITPNKITTTPHKRTPSQPSYSLYEKSASKIVSSPKRLSLSKKPLTPRKLMGYNLSVTPSKLSPSKTYLTSSRKSISKHPPTPKSTSPVKKREPWPLSLNKHKALRRTPIHGPSPRRRLYVDSNDEGIKEEVVDEKTSSPSGVSSDDLTSHSTSNSPLKAFQRVLFDDSPSRETISLLGLNSKREIRVNMSTSVTRSILEWIYTGECNEMDRLGKALLVGGSRHGVLELSKACEYHLAASLSPSNTPEMLFLAHKYEAEILKEESLSYAVLHAAEVTSQSLWATLSETAPSIILEFSRRLAHHSQTLIKENVKVPM
ncbi:hypothetical protein SK128_022827 [Halocaridina rubra]|uniref:BTB domain-containing protein n=1 Tax=Halocaridina rubra TaxID=373956 RepID=A0AAN8ZXF5_HALRR